MVEFICKNCGSNDIIEENGQRICSHCGTKYIITAEDKRILECSIDLSSDVAMLLKKCESEPERAIKYAERILEIDPNNATAKSIMAKKNNSYTSNGCYVATAVYGSYDCPQVWTLRRFRDNTLTTSWYGRAFIHIYYAISPILVKWFSNYAWFKKMWKPILDCIVRKLNNNGVENTPYNDKYW